jgi:hypothetical protein
MFGGRVIMALLNMQAAAAWPEGQSVVRRALAAVRGFYDNGYDNGEAFGRHCVVWGDWDVDGKHFSTKEEANQFFKDKKHSELAAIQLDGENEVHRFMSKRMVRVDWDKMKAWCNGKKKHSTKESPHQRSNPKSKQSMMEREMPEWEKALKGFQQHGPEYFGSNGVDLQSSLMESADQRPRPQWLEDSWQAAASQFPKAPASQPLTTSLGGINVDTGAQRDTGASTMTGKMTTLEKEVAELSRKASSLLLAVGVSKSHSLKESHQSDGKLKSRVADLDGLIAQVQEEVSLLETELFGSATAPASAAQGVEGHSLKVKIDQAAAQVDELRSRISAIESSPLLGEAGKLEEKADRLGQDATRIFAAIGVEVRHALPSMPKNLPLKDRLSTLEQWATELQKSAAKAENEVVGNSWNRGPTSDSLKAVSNSIRDHALALGEKLHDLEGRVSAVAGSPVLSDVDRMEDNVASVHARVTAISNRVGLNVKAPARLFSSPKGTPLTQRMAALEGSIKNCVDSMASLEGELLGNVVFAPAHAQQGTIRGEVKLMEMELENLNGRITVLEQQV